MIQTRSLLKTISVIMGDDTMKPRKRNSYHRYNLHGYDSWLFDVPEDEPEDEPEDDVFDAEFVLAHMPGSDYYHYNDCCGYY